MRLYRGGVFFHIMELELQVWPGTESGAELLRKDTSSAALGATTYYMNDLTCRLMMLIVAPMIILN